MRKVILYIAMSLDGYIAKADNDMTFLTIVQKDGEDYGYNDFIKEIDTVIMGRKTYDWVMTQVKEFPHADIDSYIITRTPGPAKGKISFYTGNLKELILELKQNAGKNIFIDGGAEIVNLLIQDNLIDEYIISIIPILLGDGVRLFRGCIMEQNLELISSKQYDTGLIQLHYKR